MQPRRPQGTAGAVAFDHHVADLGRGAAAEPGHPVDDNSTADPGAPPDAEQRRVLAPGAELVLAFDRDLDVVADLHLGPQSLRERLAEWEATLPAGQVAGAGDDPGLAVGVAGRADADAAQRVGRGPGGRCRRAGRSPTPV